MFDDFPMYSIQLIERLDKAFPDRCIQPGESHEDALRRAGQREVVNYLIGFAKNRCRPGQIDSTNPIWYNDQ